MATSTLSPDTQKRRPSDTWDRWHARSAQVVIECGGSVWADQRIGITSSARAETLDPQNSGGHSRHTEGEIG
jgi:hypothetical protein